MSDADEASKAHTSPNTTQEASGHPLWHAVNEVAQGVHSAAGGNVTGVPANVSNFVISPSNVTATAQPSTDDDGSSGVPGGVIALMVGLLVLGVAVFCLLLHLKRTGKLYKVIPFKRLASGPRRSSFSSSDRALHMKGSHHDDEDDFDDNFDGEYEGDEQHLSATTSASYTVASGRRHHNNNSSSSKGRIRGGGGGGGGDEGGDERDREREASAMFTIEDHDMDSVDIADGTPRGDEYFYDEVFGTSMFEDEVTNNSMRQLYLASDTAQEEDVDVDDIISSITGAKPTTTTTTTTTTTSTTTPVTT